MERAMAAALPDGGFIVRTPEGLVRCRREWVQTANVNVQGCMQGWISYRIVYSVPDGQHHTLTAVLVTDSIIKIIRRIDSKLRLPQSIV